MILLLILLILLPIITYRWARTHIPLHKVTALGISFGLIAAPFSMGLYSTFFLHPVGIVTGLPGLILSMFHGAPGYQISIELGLIPSHTVIAGTNSLLVAAVNGVFWAIIYGLLGYAIDKYRHHRHNTNKSVVRDAPR